MIDRTVPADLLDLLAVVRGEDEPVFSIGRPPAHDRLANVRPVHAPVAAPMWMGQSLRRTIPRCEILHCWSKSACLPALDLAGDGRRIVWTLEGLPDPKDTLRPSFGSGPVPLTMLAESESIRQAWIAAGVEPGRIAILPPAVWPTADRASARAKVREQLDVPQDVLLVALPAEIEWNAGHEEAIWAAAICGHAGREVHLLLPTSGPAEQKARDFAATTAFPDRVHRVAGRLDRAEALAACDAAAFLAADPTGLTRLAEAMGCGLAILATRTPEHLDLLEPDRTGLLIAPRDPQAAAAGLLKLVENRDLTARLGASASQVATGWTRSAARQVLDEIYANRTPPRRIMRTRSEARNST